jgi:hypothetical protein
VNAVRPELEATWLRARRAEEEARRARGAFLLQWMDLEQGRKGVDGKLRRHRRFIEGGDADSAPFEEREAKQIFASFWGVLIFARQPVGLWSGARARWRIAPVVNNQQGGGAMELAACDRHAWRPHSSCDRRGEGRTFFQDETRNARPGEDQTNNVMRERQPARRCGRKGAFASLAQSLANIETLAARPMEKSKQASMRGRTSSPTRPGCGGRDGAAHSPDRSGDESGSGQQPAAASRGTAGVP